MARPNDDAVWVARCLKGDAAAFETLVQRYQRVLYTVAIRLTGNAEDAQDVTQNTFIRAYERLETYDPARRFFSWIYRIAVNESLNFLRVRRPHDPLEDTFETGEQGDPVEQKEIGERVQEALLALTKEYREVVVLRYFGELSYEEIGETIGIPEKTVKSRLFSARQRLAEILAARGSFS